MWAFIHLTFLTGFKNRFVAAIRWVLSFVGRSRTERALGWDRTRATFASPEAWPGAAAPGHASGHAGGLTTVDDIDRLRRLTFNQTDGDAHAPERRPPSTGWNPRLDPKTVALVRLGALVAMGGGAIPPWVPSRTMHWMPERVSRTSSTSLSWSSRSSGPRGWWPPRPGSPSRWVTTPMTREEGAT